MASREMPPARRQHRELLKLQRDGIFTREDPQGRINVFRQYQEYGLFPLRYEDFGEMQSELVALIKSGVPKKDALQRLGIEVDVFKGNGVINGRALRDRLSPGMAEAVNMVAGDGTAEGYAKSQRKYWNAGVAENREIAPSLGYAVNEGHVDTSASGAPPSNRAAGTESAVINQMNGRSAANPPRPVSATERPNIGVANTHIAGLYEAGLQDSGLPARSGTQRLLNPYVSAALGSDATTRYIPPEQLEVFNRTFQDLADQNYNEVAMYDHVVSGGALTPEALAKAGLERRGVSTFAQAPANAAPVRSSYVDPKVLAAQRRAQAEAARVAAARYGIPPKALAALGFLPVVGALFDGGDALAGTHQAITGETRGDRLAGTFQAIGGVSGLASLSPLAPVAAPVSMVANGLAIATQRRADMDKPVHKPLYGTGRVASIVPTAPPNSKPIGNGKGGVSKPVGGTPKPANKPFNPINEGKWFLKQLGIKL
jgi:hypothetical protein